MAPVCRDSAAEIQVFGTHHLLSASVSTSHSNILCSSRLLTGWAIENVVRFSRTKLTTLLPFKETFLHCVCDPIVRLPSLIYQLHCDRVMVWTVHCLYEIYGFIIIINRFYSLPWYVFKDCPCGKTMSRHSICSSLNIWPFTYTHFTLRYAV